MKIQCGGCEKAEAVVLCCADEAALCLACDERIHAANKLATKHLRVPLTNSTTSHLPTCDICQETTGYFFCLEDRALLCRKCDVAIHTANAYVSAHKRFLLTGVKVGLEPKEPVVSSSKENVNSTKKVTEPVVSSKENVNFFKNVSETPRRRGNSMLLSGENKDVISYQAVGDGSLAMSKTSYSGGSTPGVVSGWPLEEIFGLTDFSQNYGFMDEGSSKDDSGKRGEPGWSPIYQAVADEDVDIGEYLGQVPEIPWVVPELPSPPTASGLYWPKNLQSELSADCSISVPEVCYVQDGGRYQSYPLNPKRRRQS